MKIKTKTLLALIAAIAICAVAYAQYATGTIYTEQGGAKMVVQSGAEIEFASGSTLDVDGTFTMSDLTLENGETITNSTDGDVDITFDEADANPAELNVISNSASPADADVINVNFKGEDDSSRSVEYGQILVDLDDVSSNTLDATMRFAVQTAGSATTISASELELTGAALYPTADEGLDLGGSSNEWKDLYVDGTANVDTLVIGTYTIAFYTGTITNASTTGTLTCTGIDSDDKIVGFSVKTAAIDAAVEALVPTANTVTYYLSDTADAESTIELMVRQD